MHDLAQELIDAERQGWEAVASGRGGGGSTDSGIVVYRLSGQRGGEELYVAIVSSAFIGGGGRWVLALVQQSPA